MSDSTTRKEYDMRARITKLMAALTVVGALAVGGAAFAGAASTPTPPPAPPAVTADADTLQQGDQTTPDTGAAASESSTASSTESSTESASSSEVAGPSDGPGGHADDPSNTSVDYQFQGVQ
jgi:cytoskeletal protein RodZ